jgi:GT2 family glycosyltransferase
MADRRPFGRRCGATAVGGYSRVRVFVRRGADLVGSVDVWHRGADSISIERLQDEIARRLARQLLKLDLKARLGAAVASAEPRLPPQTVSVIVPTCGLADDLRRCLRSLLTQRTRHTLEIIVVDNRPSDETAALVAGEFPSVRLVREPRVGLSYARNTGILHSAGSIIVTTDDDVVAQETWIESLVAPFARADVMCVTGHVLPSELQTEAQCRFEAYGGLGKGFEPREVDGAWFRSLRTAVPTWTLGATANAAFRRSIFSDPAIGPLDEALGAGTPTGCSEDTLLFYRILAAGGSIVYEPSAYVWHRHRESMAALRRQIYAYSKGHVAYQLTTLTRHADRRALVRLCYSLPKTYAGRAWQRLRRQSEYPLQLIALEVLGSLAGPWALWRSRRRVRRVGQAPRPAEVALDAVPVADQASQEPVRGSRVRT